MRLARAGKAVVRLKGGDPGIFGRATEELEACEAAGVPVSIVPGITAAQAAAAALGLSLTERRHARRLHFVTGHGADGELPTDLDWRALADRHATTVVYMPRRTLPGFVRAATAAGLDPATPALAIADVARASQQWVSAPLSALAPELARLPERAPVTVVIGQVARRLVAVPEAADLAA